MVCSPPKKTIRKRAVILIHPTHKPNKTSLSTLWPFPLSTFKGKEKDSESGFHYYGARYYWSETLTGWLSVDPIADRYPGMSPYAYCVWNPVKLVDPDGRDGIPVINKRKRTITVEVNIIFYMSSVGHIGRKQINTWMENIMSEINNKWNSKDWTYAYQGEQYKVDFQFSYVFDNNVHDESDFHFDTKNNKNNYIELSPQSTYQYNAKTGRRNYKCRSSVKNHNSGIWFCDSKSAPYEVGHLLYLPDRYHCDPDSKSGYSPDKGWDGNIMAEPEGQGHVTQKDVNAVLDILLNGK